MSVIQTLMMSPDKASALGWLGAQGGDFAARAAAMSSLTDLQFKGLQLYLISLLPTWGKLVYTTWLHQGQSGPGAAGLVVTRPVQQLLYGEWRQWGWAGSNRVPPCMLAELGASCWVASPTASMRLAAHKPAFSKRWHTCRRASHCLGF